MNLVLMIRGEITDLLILIFLLIYSSIYCQHKRGDRFQRICLLAIGHVILEMVTLITVNSPDLINTNVNYLYHLTFFIFSVFFVYEFFCYVISLTLSHKLAKKCNRIALALPILFIMLMPFLPVEYVSGRGTNYSYGPCVFVEYTIVGILFFGSLISIVCNYKKLEPTVRGTLITLTLLPLVGAIVQKTMIPELLFMGAGVTLLTLATFFAIENPAGKYRDRAYIDLDTGVKNKNCYDESLKHLSEKYRSGDDIKPITCVVCDLNGLKKVNDLYGHIAGDELIRGAATALSENLKSAYDVYRIGGDEFVGLYIDTAVEKVEKEISNVRDACVAASVGKKHPLSIAIGYAQSADDKELITETIQNADKLMYENKQKIKRENPDISVR